MKIMRSIVLGMGSGRCGTLALATLINNQAEAHMGFEASKNRNMGSIRLG